MAINPDAVGTRSDTVRRAWTSKDAILYALGVGAGTDPLQELPYTTEHSTDHPQQVLPTMAVVLGGRTGGVFRALGTYDGAMVVQTEQRFEQHQPIPPDGELESITELIGVYDKERYAHIVSRTTAVLVANGQPLFTNVGSVFIKGEGGWGGDRGPATPPDPLPERDPDEVFSLQTASNQALLYRQSGDRNAIHSDPAVAKRVGYKAPILHGLCTYGFAGRVLLNEFCGGDSARVRGMSGRFASPVYPGDALDVRAWSVAPGSVVFEAVQRDGSVALSRGVFDFASE